ncbi:DUF1534 domain-containing protein [Pseudomonas syringae]|uniref:DUF1534 domain-containing protein n=1 Tax=Pseudomonas syringae TaxID=317 RepID=A0A6B2BD46_PSESX|nr:DUF1534 domain-containing protein [Pseudomonas syringae]NAO44208.1 DUF1534 domain-containing protein [Pseudomonas syringae]NAO48972.1 DUF1534 domain-containing protein [Pseudomonas syringae]NAO62724.1 DUF1534 domain-containing protein [Pseudomonas syringae]NAO67800.1 DUF1534 domain-containing protein [Pseudomonas syringae]
MRLSFLTLQPGNAGRDALRHRSATCRQRHFPYIHLWNN